MKDLTKIRFFETLLLIKDAGEFFPSLGNTEYLHMKRLRLRNWPSYSKLYRIEKHGLIKKKKAGRFVGYYLSEEGKRIVERINIKQDRNDGLSTVIIFDVPEERHNQRNIFRRYLVKNGYTLLQKSVFISPYVLTERIKELVKELRLENHVTILDARVNRSNY